VIDAKNLEPDRFQQPMTGTIVPMSRNQIRPITYPHSRVGTVLADALEFCIALEADRVDTIGFPLYLPEYNHHWTETGEIYTPGMSWYMKPEVFVDVAGYRTIWAWGMSAAYLRSVTFPFVWTDYSEGLLDVKGIDTALKYIDDHPHDIRL
jgi:hypothetical protein